MELTGCDLESPTIHITHHKNQATKAEELSLDLGSQIGLRQIWGRTMYKAVSNECFHSHAGLHHYEIEVKNHQNFSWNLRPIDQTLVREVGGQELASQS